MSGKAGLGPSEVMRIYGRVKAEAIVLYGELCLCALEGGGLQLYGNCVSVDAGDWNSV
jgi:hypothetical protein